MNKPMGLFEQHALAQAVSRKPVMRKLRTVLIEHFTSCIGDDDVCVLGDFEPVDRDCDFRGDYTVTHVWISGDAEQLNLLGLLTKLEKESLAEQGYAILYEREMDKAYDAKADAADHYRDEDR